jgi:TonB family protein
MNWLIVVFVGVLIYPESAFAQQDRDLPTWEWEMEEILVIGERSLHSLQMEIYKAEDIKVKLFNSLNSTDDFDIKCEYVAHTGSIIKDRVCDAGYMKKARAEDARLFMDYMQDDLPFLHRSDHQLTGEFAHKTEALNKEMIELAVKHPSLAKAMINEYALKQLYIAEWRERFKDSILIGHTKPEEYFGDELKFIEFAYLAYKDGMLEEQIWNYWDKRLRSVIHQEPYRSIWLSSNHDKYADEFIAYVNTILSGEVDTSPSIIHAGPPTYPFEAEQKGIEGKVTVQFLVTKEGTVRDPIIFKSSPVGVFDQAAIETVTQYTFKPGTKGGEAVDVIVRMPIVFQLPSEGESENGETIDD